MGPRSHACWWRIGSRDAARIAVIRPNTRHRLDTSCSSKRTAIHRLVSPFLSAVNSHLFLWRVENRVSGVEERPHVLLMHAYWPTAMLLLRWGWQIARLADDSPHELNARLKGSRAYV